MKTAGIIVIGDEILKGQVADQNIAFLAPRLHNLGIKLRKVSIISDSVEEIAKEVAEFSSKYDTVITTGGVGPTHDDVTYEGVAAAFGESVVVSQDIVKFWSYFTLDPKGKNAATKRLTSIPKSAVVLYPDVPKTSVAKGQFPVVTMKNVIIFPGVPKFLQIIFNALEGTYFSSHGVVFYNKAIYLNASEQQITDVLNDAVQRYGPGVQFGSYPKYDNDYYRVIITLESESMVEVNKAYDYLFSQLDQKWISKDGNLLGNAYKNTLDLINSKKFNDFGPILEKSIQTIEKCFDDFNHNEVFISFNGGKDCTALLHLVHSVMQKKYGQKAYPRLTGVYFRPQHAFKEVEDFIQQSACRYNVNLITRDGPIRQSLEALVKEEGRGWKACLMGVRRNDPNCKNLNYIQETDEGWPRLIRVSPILDWTFQDVWTYLKELQVPYCPLYDKGKLLLNDKPLEEFRRKVEEISNLLKTMIGPSGRSIAINYSGHITITKSGTEIIDLFKHKGSPETNFVIGCMENLYREFGDGSKTFIVLLEALLFHSQNYTKDYLIQHFSMFLKVYDSIPKIENSGIDYCKIIDTFFSTRFPQHVSYVLSALLKDWIEENRSSDGNVFKNILNHFDALVTVEKISSPLNESKVIKGLSINGNFHGKFPNHNTNLKLIIIYFTEEHESSQDDINSIVLEITLALEKLNFSNLLIITNCTLPPSSLQMLNKYHILTNVATESVHLLNSYISANNYNNFENPPDVNVFTAFNSFRSDFILQVPFGHLTLCSPSKTFSDSYLKSFKSCLKLCSKMLIDNSLLVDCCKFEKLLRLQLIGLYKENTNVFSEELVELEFSNYLNLGTEELCLYEKNLNNSETEFVKVIEYLKPKLQTIDCDIILIVIKMLNTYILKNVPNGMVGIEPLNLKIEILNRVFNTYLNILNIDQVLKM